MKRHHLSKKDRKKIIEFVRKTYGIELESSNIEYLETRETEGYIVDGELAFIKTNDRIIPSLKWLLKKGHCFLPKIIVDMGAVRPVSSGANVMAPGVVGVKGEFKEGDTIVIIDEKHGAPLAVGIAEMSSDKIMSTEKGVVAKNIHHIGDKFWKTSLSFS